CHHPCPTALYATIRITLLDGELMLARRFAPDLAAPALQRVADEPIAFPIGWTLRLPYPLRNAVSRWRTLLSMIVGVGIALSIGMTILAVISAEMDLLTGDYERSGV